MARRRLRSRQHRARDLAAWFPRRTRQEAQRATMGVHTRSNRTEPTRRGVLRRTGLSALAGGKVALLQACGGTTQEPEPTAATAVPPTTPPEPTVTPQATPRPTGATPAAGAGTAPLTAAGPVMEMYGQPRVDPGQLTNPVGDTVESAGTIATLTVTPEELPGVVLALLPGGRATPLTHDASRLTAGSPPTILTPLACFSHSSSPRRSGRRGDRCALPTSRPGVAR